MLKLLASWVEANKAHLTGTFACPILSPLIALVPTPLCTVGHELCGLTGSRASERFCCVVINGMRVLSAGCCRRWRPTATALECPPRT